VDYRAKTTGHRADEFTRTRNRRASSLARLTRDRRGGALVEHILAIGLIAIVGLLAWPKFGSAANHKVERQAECGLLNADCNGGPSSGGGQGGPSPASPSPAPVSPGLQGKLDQLASTGALPTPSGQGGGQGGSGGPSKVSDILGSAGDVVVSAGTGFLVDGFWGTVTGVVHVVTHPKQTFDGIVDAASDPFGTMGAIKDSVANAWNEDPVRFGGAVAFDLVTLPFAVLKVAKVGKLRKLGKLTDEMDDGVPAATPAAPALPARQIQAAWGASKYKHGGLMNGIEHIMYRHAANSGFANVSRYAPGTTARQVTGYVDDALRHGTVTQTGPAAFTVEHTFTRTIGTNIAGAPANSIRVYVRDGIIQTAFPF
jgi:hypothetical protein